MERQRTCDVLFEKIAEEQIIQVCQTRTAHDDVSLEGRKLASGLLGLSTTHKYKHTPTLTGISNQILTVTVSQPISAPQCSMCIEMVQKQQCA